MSANSPLSNPRAGRLGAALMALLIALPLAALPTSADGPVPANVPLSHPEYPLGSWKMFHANPEHTGEGATLVPPAGHVVWSYADPINQSSDTPEGGVAVDNGIAYVGLGNRMTALNATTGAKLWSYPASGRIVSTPALSNGLLYFGAGGSPGADNFFAINATTGGLVWKANESSGLGLVQYVHDSPTVASGLVYYGSYTYWFYARDALNGSLAWSANLTSEVLSSPAESGGIVYVASAGIHDPVLNSWDVAPRLWAFNSLSGAEVWNQTVVSGQLIASPVVDGGSVYIATAGFSYTIDVNSGYLLAFDASTGSPLWASPDIGRAEATPAVRAGAMYVATAGQQGLITSTDARLRKLDLATSGSVVWSQPVGSNAAMFSSPAVVGNLVVAASRDGTVGVWTTGGVGVWSYALCDEVTAPPAVVSELIVVPCLNGAVVAFGAQPDFAVDPADLSVSDSTPHVGEPLTLTAIVRNIGDKKGSASAQLMVNVSGNLTPLATDAITDLNFGGAFAASTPFTPSVAGPHEWEVQVGNVTPPDGNASNDMAVLSFTVLPRLDGWRSRYADDHGSNFQETWTPQNNIPKWSNLSFGATGSGAIAFENSVVLARNDTLFAFARDNGSDLRWAFLSSQPIVGTPALAAGLIVFASAQANDTAGNVTILDPDTGGLVAVVPLPARPTVSPVALDSQVLLGLADRLVLLSLANRSVEREFPPIDVPLPDRPAIQTEPVVSAGTAFVVSSVGEIHAFNLTTGAVPAGFPISLQARTAVPITIVGAFLIAVNGSTNVSAFPLSPPSPVPVWTAPIGEAVNGPLAAGYGRVFVSTAAGNVSALSIGSGLRVWNRTLAPPQGSSAVRAVGNDTVFVGGASLFALSATDGQTRWEYAPGPLGSLAGPVAMSGGTLHLQTSGGALVTLGLVPGTPPIAGIDTPRDGARLRVGEAVTFVANSSGNVSTAGLNYTWDLGDGNYSTGNVTQHVYGFAGTFLVRLTVSDPLGLSSASTALVTVTMNQPPILAVGANSLDPPPVGHRLDNTTWTLRVTYADGNGDPPTYIRVNISNEPNGVKDLLPEGPGPYDFTTGVTYAWSGALSSNRHNYSFVASDGIDSASTPTSSTFDVYRVESYARAPLITMEALYVGDGTSTVPDGPNLAAPAGLIVIDRIDVRLPANATLLQWLNVTYFYGIADINRSLFLEDTIRFYWYSDADTQWEEVGDSGVFVDQQLAWANSTHAGGIFGLFGQPKVVPQRPLAVPQVREGRSVFSPGESITFIGAESTDPGGLGLTYLWEFGDGNSSTLVNPTHAYNATGNYVVRLTVTNSFGLNHTATYPITIRTEASASTFLWIAIVIVAALFALFALIPAWRRREESPPSPPRDLPPPSEDEKAPAWRGAASSVSQKPARASPAKRGQAVPVDDDESQVLDELQRDYENGGSPKPPP